MPRVACRFRGGRRPPCAAQCRGWNGTPAGCYHPAMIATLLTTLVLAATAARLPFIENDYARALATARAQKKPIFIEAWAPW